MDHPGRAPLKVLVVEDHADTAASMALLLRLYGHEAYLAADGAAALEAAHAVPPDVVLLDIALPGPMNGWEVAHRLRARAGSPRTFLIAMTGFGQAEHRRRSAEAGIDLHLVKPVDPARLQAILAELRVRADAPETAPAPNILVCVAAAPAGAPRAEEPGEPTLPLH
jgi:CheY-like chemotaxis protein